MKRIAIAAMALAAVLPTTLGSVVLGAQDKYSVRVTDGLSFAEFKGYEDWQTIAVSQTGEVIDVILGNPIIVAAYRAGVPGDGKPFPEGARMAKIHWKSKASDDAPAPTTVPGVLQDIDFMVKDSRRFQESGGWGYAQFNYESATQAFTSEGTGTNCGAACHTIAKAKDFVFTSYPMR